MKNFKIAAVIVIFILLNITACAFSDTTQQSMLFIEEGLNIKLTPNPIVTIGKISLTDSISLPGNITANQIYGDTSVHPDGNITIDIETQDVHRNITGFDVSNLNGFMLQDDSLVAQVDGKYKVDYWLSTAGGVKKIYESCIAVNGEHQTPHAHRKQGAAGDIGSMSGGGIINLTAGDIVNLQIRNTEGTQNVVIFNAGMRLIRVGD